MTAVSSPAHQGGCEWSMSGVTDFRSWSFGHVTNSTIMRKWKWLFMNGCECKNHIYMTMEFLNLCQGVRGVLGLCWRVVFHCNKWATLNTVMMSHKCFMTWRTLVNITCSRLKRTGCCSLLIFVLKVLLLLLLSFKFLQICWPLWSLSMCEMLVPWFSWLVTSLSPQRLWFDHRRDCVGFVVDRVAMGHVFLWVFVSV